jgi:hypothetical protein
LTSFNVLQQPKPTATATTTMAEIATAEPIQTSHPEAVTEHVEESTHPQTETALTQHPSADSAALTTTDADGSIVKKTKKIIRRKRRPARPQVDPSTIKSEPPPQTGTVFNIWYNKWSVSKARTSSADAHGIQHMLTKWLKGWRSGRQVPLQTRRPVTMQCRSGQRLHTRRQNRRIVLLSLLCARGVYVILIPISPMPFPFLLLFFFPFYVYVEN